MLCSSSASYLRQTHLTQKLNLIRVLPQQVLPLSRPGLVLWRNLLKVNGESAFRHLPADEVRIANHSAHTARCLHLKCALCNITRKYLRPSGRLIVCWMVAMQPAAVPG